MLWRHGRCRRAPQSQRLRLTVTATAQTLATVSGSTVKNLERVMGIEPTLFAWEARVLPLNDTREASDYRVGPAGDSSAAFQVTKKARLESYRGYFMVI